MLTRFLEAMADGLSGTVVILLTGEEVFISHVRFDLVRQRLNKPGATRETNFCGYLVVDGHVSDKLKHVFPGDLCPGTIATLANGVKIFIPHVEPGEIQGQPRHHGYRIVDGFMTLKCLEVAPGDIVKVA